MTRISRNIEDGFLYVLGVSFEDLYTNWLNHYQNAYNTENQNNKLNTGEPLDLKIPEKIEFIKISRLITRII